MTQVLRIVRNAHAHCFYGINGVQSRNKASNFGGMRHKRQVHIGSFAKRKYRARNEFKRSNMICYTTSTFDNGNPRTL